MPSTVSRANPAFDAGPLSWVRGEIEYSFNEARNQLDKISAESGPADVKAVKRLVTQLHQVTGALSMVGLGAAAHFNEELEKLGHTLDPSTPRLPTAPLDRISLIKQATATISAYLDSLMAGAPNRPMCMAELYVAVNKARGANDAAESDLFSPDLSVQIAMPGSEAPTVSVDSIKQQRSLYQAGLLKLLRDRNLPGGTHEMHQAISAIEAMQSHAPSRAFWLIATGFFDALEQTDTGSTAVALFGKIDQQIRHLIDGVHDVPEKLFRDLLLIIGKSTSSSERIENIRALYDLNELLAHPGLPISSLKASEVVQTAVREMREVILSQKDNWLKFTSGNRAALEPYAMQAETLAQASATLESPLLTQLLQTLAAVAAHLRKQGLPANDSLGLEVATALLFLDSTLENFSNLSADFDNQANIIIKRVNDVMAGVAPTSGTSNDTVGRMTRQAQESLLIFQVGHEVQVNLQMIENVLDNYFRDHSKTADLTTLPALFSQVNGALAMLEKNDAAALCKVLAERVGTFTDDGDAPNSDKHNEVAEGISALGLYVTALQQNQPNLDEILTPALISLGLVEKQPEMLQMPLPISQSDLEIAKQKVFALYEEWKQSPQQSDIREQLNDAVQQLRQRAEIVADTRTIKQCQEVLDAIALLSDPDRTSLREAMREIAPERPADTPTASTAQLVDATSAEVDQELLEIFLEEAIEVIATVNEQLNILRTEVGNLEALTTIRRSFHTLKGSGRMVGLTELGEVGWQCEQVLNKWLKEEKLPTPGLLGFIERAANSFSHWVNDLRESAQTHVDGHDIVRYADALKHDQEPTFTDAVERAATPTTEQAVSSANLPEIIEAETSEPILALVDEPDQEVVPLAPLASITFEETPAASQLAMAATLTEAATSTLSEPNPFDYADLEATLLASPTGEAITQPQADISTASPSDLAGDTDTAIIPPFFDPLPDLSFLDVIPATSSELVPEAAPAVAPLEDSQETAAQADEIRIGDNTLSVSLFNIFLNEADQHAETLQSEMAALEANPSSPVSAAFMRAAHTLHSTSGATNFVNIAELAHPLEKWLQAAIEHTPEFDAERFHITRQAIAALCEMVQGLHVLLAPRPQPESIAQLNQLCEALKATASTGENSLLRYPLETDHDDAHNIAAPTEVPIADQQLETPTETPIESIAEAATALPPIIEIGSPSVTEFAASTEESAAAAIAEVSTPSPAEVAVTVAPDITLPSAEPEPTSTPVAPAAIAATTIATTSLDKLVADQAAYGGRDRRTMQDDVDADLLPIFLEEATELLPQIGDGLRAWRSNPQNHTPVLGLTRHLHTLKGSSRMAGLMRLGALAHAMETKLMALDALSTPPDLEFDDIESAIDRINADLERLSKGESLAPAIELPAISDTSEALPTPIAKLAAARAEVIAEGERIEGRERQAQLRVNASQIDRFVNEAGEMAIARSRIDQEVMTFKRSLQELSDNIGRMRSQLREIEIQAESQIQSRQKEAEETGHQFDPLEFDRFSRMQELTRFMAESLHDVVTMHQSLQNNLDEADAALRMQGRLNRDLQQGLMSMRLVPIGNLQDRFYRLVRQTAKELGKKANLEFRGARVEIDRSVLEKIIAPLEHLLRNAIAHGLEIPELRLKAGKQDIGEIQMDVQQLGNEVIITLADDGAGLNFERIRSKAIAEGLMQADDIVSEQQLTQFIFMSGFTTAANVTEVSGRGVGMDVVHNEIISLGGHIEISSSADKGTRFVISLPLTLALTQAVIVMVGETRLAIPAVMIEQVQEYKGKRYEPLLDMTEINWNNNRYPLYSMEALLGGKPKVSALRKAMVVLTKSGQQRVAVQVDSIIGNREIVVKPIGPQLARLPGIAGATIMGNGQIMLIMNPVQLVYRDTTAQNPSGLTQPSISAEMSNKPAIDVLSTTHINQPSPEHIAEPSRPLSEAIAVHAAADLVAATGTLAVAAVPLVMVVDDSLTVRKITSRMLTREGFEVVTAKDGMDALQQLEDVMPALILLDVEMPRMDGFEFARNVRMDARLKGIPIIMITSRTADKHRDHALQIGVNEYMGKPYQEDQLMLQVRHYTQHPKT